MANNNTAPEPQNSIDALNDRLTGMGSKLENNKKTITIAVIVLLAVIIAILAYIYLVRNPKVARQAEAIGVPDTQLALGNDSIAMIGYLDVADQYGSPRAEIMAAGLLYNDGKYEEAIAALDGISAPEELTAAAAQALKGDAYSNLNKMPEAIDAYKKALKESKDNPYYTPYFMLKLARAYHNTGDHATEAATYEQIDAEYPLYAANAGIDLQKYITRAKTLAAQAAK